jgi:pimeloyl-ACP methyl ester carboxylesterase
MSSFRESTVRYTDRYICVRGLQLHYVDYGGNGDTVLALHGLLQNAHAFDGIAPLLVPQLHLIALDLPGRGGSEWASQDRYRLMEYLLDLSSFLNALGLRQFAFIGTSLGGWMARMYAISHPEQVTRLVLNDCAVGANLAAASEILVRMMDAATEFTDMDEAVEWFVTQREGLECLDDAALGAWVSHYLIPSETGGLCFHCDPQVLRLAHTKAKLLASQPVSGPYRYDAAAWEQLRRLSMPVLILRGARSKVVPRSAVARLIRVLPRAQWVEVPGAGHSPTLYEPVAQEALRAFFGVAMSTVPPGGGSISNRVEN